MKPGRKKKVSLAAAAGLIGLAALIALSGPSAERRELNHWLDRSRNANLHSEEFYEEQGPALAPRLLEVMREKPSSLKGSIQRWGAWLGWNERNTDYLKRNHEELRRQTERSQMAADVFHRVEWDT